MAQGIFAHTRWRNLEQWRVRWKVGAAVALPLAAAILLGGLRLTVFFGDYSEYNSAADRISDIPAITALESAASTVAGGQVYGTTTDQDLVELSTAITEATVRAGRKGIDATVARALRQMTATSEVIRSGGKGGGDPVKAIELNNAIVADAIGTVDKLLTPIGVGSVVAAKAQLSDVLAGKVEGFNWLMAAMSAIQQPSQAESFHTEQGRILAMGDAIERVMPAAKPDLDRVVRPNNAVLKDMIEVAMRTHVVDLVELRRLAIESRDVFTGLTRQIVQGVIHDVDDKVAEARSAAVQASLVVLGTVIAALALALWVAHSLLQPLRRLRAGANELAEKDLPSEVERIMRGAQLEDIEVKPVPVHTGEEIGEIARTVDGLHTQALKLAAQQQLLRDQVNDMFETMARRNQTLVDRQLSMIEALEFEEKDPERLGHLFRLDHLAARMRRNSANLLVLAGTRSRHDRSGPVEVRDILRAAVSEVEDYQRVKSGATPDGWVAGIAATDVVHLIAEMLENALRASPPDSDVTFAYSRTSEGGLLIEVVDEGIGIVANELNEINQRLATPTAATVATTRQMGMFVVGKLAERHGITVRLRRTHDRALSPGITASLHIPPALIEVPSQDSDDPATLKPVIPVHRDTLGTKATAEAGAGVAKAGAGIAETATKTVTPAAKAEPAARRIGAPPSAAPKPAEPEPDAPAAPPVITSYGLPKRVPGVNRKGRRKAGGAAAKPASTTAAAGAPAPSASVADSGPPTGPQERVAKTTSFFQTEDGDSAESVESTSNGSAQPTEGEAATPIFAGMMSAWLADPTTGELPILTNWHSAADEGWSAAQRAADVTITERTTSGLPKRDPGNQLVPGGAESGSAATESAASTRRDPEAIRTGLNRYQRGVRDGRATGKLKPLAAEDVR
ncbi:HAMP domain-containing sensor histidine kinase [Nocardia anaemiae]|uniref:HAMP domain-containing sensor histidine kinase n=1 Tax=Nocardia anaemiae TaxID=263910 RepID=UPI0007A46315|nr:ATP-binding protein [Nocardia anaemiae]